jgi:HTH-type transcriptional regulator, sugar sensing transcriptional regulator
MITSFAEYSILGLEPRDMYVYDALFKMEHSSLRSIAAATGMNRGTVYEVIKKLMDLGLVTFKQTGERRRYSAAQPDVLLALIQDRRDRLQQLESSASDYAKALKTGQQSGHEFFASFYEGDEGIAAILRDVLQTLLAQDRPEYCVISSRDVSNFLYSNFKSFSRQRVKAGKFVRVIADSPSEDKVVLAERRQLPPNRDPLNGYVIIYGDKTAIISLNETNVLSGIVITDGGVANMQRLIFDQLWQSLAL